MLHCEGSKNNFVLTRESRIILLIWGSFIPSIYYGFAEDMEWVRVYWSMVSYCGSVWFSLPQFMRLD